MLSTVIVLASLAGFSHSAEGPSWSHYDEASWPGQCGIGKEQSPIDIRPHETLSDPLGSHLRGDLVFRGYNDVRVQAQNTGYKVMWEAVAGEPTPTLSGGPLRGNYSFAEVHLHWLSEHSIDGIKYPLEIHIVHTKYGLSLNDALQQRDGIAVIGILGQVSADDNSTVLSELLPAMNYILKRSDPSTKIFNVDLTRLFGPNPQAYYSYHGSLTTPLCPEVVTWIVMEEPLTVSHAQYKNLTRADMDGINNDRRVQPLGQRLVFRSNAASAACSHLASSTLLGTLATLVSCLGSKATSTLLSTMNKIVAAKKKLFGQLKQQSK